MKVSEIIDRYNTERPNGEDDQLKIGWLKKCEHMIYNDVLCMYDYVEEQLEDFGMDYELIVPEPYDDIYFYYMDQRIALNGNDTSRANRARTEYNNALISFQAYCNRAYRRKQPRSHLIHHDRL